MARVVADFIPRMGNFIPCMRNVFPHMGNIGLIKLNQSPRYGE